MGNLPVAIVLSSWLLFVEVFWVEFVGFSTGTLFLLLSSYVLGVSSPLEGFANYTYFILYLIA